MAANRKQVTNIDRETAPTPLSMPCRTIIVAHQILTQVNVLKVLLKAGHVGRDFA